MPKPEIIGSARSTYTRVVCMVCEEKRIEYLLTERPLGAPELLAIHPLGKMPVLRHGDVELFESRAIASWLDRSFPAPYVFPSDPHHAALTEQWVSLVNSVMDRTLIRTYIFAYIAPMMSGREPDREAIEAAMPAVREQLGILDRAVARTGYLAGDRFTFADINLLPILHRVGQFPEGACCCDQSRRILRVARGAAEFYAHHAALRPATPDHGGLVQNPSKHLDRRRSRLHRTLQSELGWSIVATSQRNCKYQPSRRSLIIWWNLNLSGEAT